MARKVFVGVKVHVDLEGKMKPLEITWDDGRVFEIDRITDVRQAVSVAAGGNGIRYMCMIKDKAVPLFCENPRWFMEGK
jgi:hypothetical protein